MSTLRISASRFSACAGEYSELLRQQMLERHLQRVTEKRHQHMCLHPLLINKAQPGTGKESSEAIRRRCGGLRLPRRVE